MLRAFFAAVLILLALAAQAQTQEQMCAGVWDVALVSRTLSKHGIPREQARAMLADIYNTPDADSRRLVEKLADFAYQHTETEPKPFAGSVRRACLHGQLGKMLGIET